MFVSRLHGTPNSIIVRTLRPRCPPTDGYSLVVCIRRDATSARHHLSCREACATSSSSQLPAPSTVPPGPSELRAWESGASHEARRFLRCTLPPQRTQPLAFRGTRSDARRASSSFSHPSAVWPGLSTPSHSFLISVVLHTLRTTPCARQGALANTIHIQSTCTHPRPGLVGGWVPLWLVGLVCEAPHALYSVRRLTHWVLMELAMGSYVSTSPAASNEL